MISPEAAALKWQRRASAAGVDYKTGVEGVTTNPCELAADNIDKMQANLMARFADGTIEAKLRAVSLSSWKSITAGKGAANYATGVAAAGDKTRAAFNSLFPHIQAGVDQIKTMPDLTIEHAIARSAAMIRHMHEYSG